MWGTAVYSPLSTLNKDLTISIWGIYWSLRLQAKYLQDNMYGTLAVVCISLKY